MKYKLLIFDADETLFDFKKSEKVAFEKNVEDFSLEGCKEELYKTYKEINTKIWKELEDGLITQKKLKVERFKRFGDKVGETFNPEVFAKGYMKHLSEASFLYDNSVEILEDLKNKEYRMTILTNGLKAVQDNRIRKSTIAKYFEDIVVSEEVGISKPNPDIYKHALENINFEAKNKNQVLMIGDNLNSDIKGGMNYGIDTCWLNVDEKVNKLGEAPTYEISKLEELKNLL